VGNRDGEAGQRLRLWRSVPTGDFGDEDIAATGRGASTGGAYIVSDVCVQESGMCVSPRGALQGGTMKNDLRTKEERFASLADGDAGFPEVSR